MTFKEFILKLRELALQQSEPVLAIDFEMADGEIRLRFRFKNEGQRPSPDRA